MGERLDKKTRKIFEYMKDSDTHPKVREAARVALGKLDEKAFKRKY
jgi:hypothetical protein